MTDITIPPEALKEKVVAAIRDAWNNASNDGNPISYHMADAAIAVALEEAAEEVERLPVFTFHERNDFTKGQYTTTHTCAAAIRALKASAAAADS